MSGTDHAKDEGWQGRQPVFVLVEPQMGENIGAAARGMWNFGLERMRLVNPRDGWPNPKAVAMASGAARVLDQVQVFHDTGQAVADCHHVYATTARSRDLIKEVLSPERALGDMHQRLAKGQKTAVLFGPERAGLENSDIVHANTLISVPVNPAFGSLNLAQCVLLTAYEWRRVSQESGIAQPSHKETSAASRTEIDKLYGHLFERLENTGFFWPEQKAESMALNLRNMISRMPLTDSDVRMVHGVIRALSKGKT